MLYLMGVPEGTHTRWEGTGMADHLRASTAGVRIHQFVVGSLPVIAYLSGWLPPLWAALGLSMLALISERLVVMDWLVGGQKHCYEQEDPGPRAGLFRLDEAMRVILLGSGTILLTAGHPIGWLPTLAVATASVMEGTTAFSFALLAYALLTWCFQHIRPDVAAACDSATGHPGNPNCFVCRSLRAAPYGRCRWCHLSSMRWCCGLQTSLLMALLLVIAFLLTATLGAAMTKVLVTLSIVGVVTLSLAVSRQTDDLIGSLNNLADAHKRTAGRCRFLERLSLAGSIQEAADATVAHATEAFGVRRVSVMLIKDSHLQIAAAVGIPGDVVKQVRVPIPNRICGQVFASGEPLIVNDLGAEEFVETLGLGTGGPVASFPLVAAPMKTATRRIGVINVTDRDEGAFTDEDLSELQFTAEAAAISLSSQMDRRDIERGNYAAIRSLALAIEAKDPCTHGHSLRVQVWATAVARELGLSGERLQALTYAAELHDIGKIAIPDEILRAPRKLIPEEWAIVEQHPRRGMDMVRHLEFLQPAREGILHHNERLDGRGYPDGLAGHEIPLEARVLAVVDAYDAMTSARPYRPPLSHEKAAAELRRASGTQFDPRCVEVFLGLVGEGAELVAAGASVPATVDA